MACALHSGGARGEAGSVGRDAAIYGFDIRSSDRVDAESRKRPKPGSAGGGSQPAGAPEIDKLWARARNRYGLSRDEFLSCSPCEFDLLLRDEIGQIRERVYPAALICSVLANLHRDPEKRPDAWQPADFMPGAVVKTEREELLEFAERVARGETFDAPDPEEMQRCRQELQKTFSNVT